MSEPNTLIVPISVEALCVGRGDTNVEFVKPSADFSLLPFGNTNTNEINLSSTVLRTTQTERKQPGIYLHWAMPDGLARANAANPDDPITVPPVPNRWLMARFVTDASDESNPVFKPAFFMVESDHLATDSAHSTLTFPVDTAGVSSAPPFRFLGKVTPIQTRWTEPDPTAGGTLHVLGYGEPTFAALLPNCENVFALYDDLANVSKGILTYAVIGWFNRSADDPMSRPEWSQPASTFTGINNPFRWFFDLPAGAVVPNRSVYQGMIAGIDWDPSPDKAYMPESEDPIEISGETTVAIGNTAGEAIAAFIAETTQLEGSSTDVATQRAAIEELLNALQVSAFSEITRDTPGGLAETEERIHEAGFSRRSGGTVWTIRDEKGGDAQIPPGSNLGPGLNDLNGAQEAVDVAGAELASRQHQLFLDWVKYILLKYSQNNDDQNTARTKLDPFLQGEIGVIDDLLTSLASNRTTLSDKRASLQAAIDQVNKPPAPPSPPDPPIHQNRPRLGLNSTPAPGFWQPAEPVVVLSGPHLAPSARHGGNGLFTLNAAAFGRLLPIIPSGSLVCLLADQRVSSLTIAQGAVTGSAEIRLSESDLTALFPVEIDTGGESFGPLLIELLVTSLLLDPDRANILAAVIAKRGGTGNPAVIDFAGLTTQISAAISAAVSPDATAANPGPVVLNGRVPSQLGMTIWRGFNPWVPIALDWRISMRPFEPVKISGGGNIYSRNFILKKFALDPDEIDLHYDYLHNNAPETEEFYSNSTILSRHAVIDLRQQIEKLKQHLQAQTSSDSEFADLLKTLNDLEHGLSRLPVMSQALGGFNEALIMRDQVLQIPIGDPMETTDPQLRQLTRKTRTAVGANNTAAPLTDNFYNPIRAGELRLNELRIIDAFGRIKKMTFEQGSTVPKLIISRNLQSPGQNDPRAAVLAPRITQPAQLEFRWLSADDDQLEMNSDPITTPVCGWILLNRLEQSLAIFDSDGNPIGSFYSLDEGTTSKWVGAPASPFFGRSPQGTFGTQSPFNLNHHLCEFALGINDNGPAFLKSFLAILDESLGLIEPNASAEDPATAVYFGRPIALARAKLDLELEGLPAFDQSIDALTVDADLNNGGANPQFTKRTDDGFSQVQFPVRLGELSKLDDGLVGFFKSRAVDAATDYGKLFAPALALLDELGKPLPLLDAHILEPTPATLTLTPSPDSGSVFVSLLVDPRSKVHATTGLFPVKAIDIPTHHYTPALEKMTVTFLTAPILTQIGALGMPVPLATQGTWSWLSDPGDGSGFLVSDVGRALQGARFDFAPQELLEGWLRLDQALNTAGPAAARGNGGSRTAGSRRTIAASLVIEESASPAGRKPVRDSVPASSDPSSFPLQLKMTNLGVEAGDGANQQVIFAGVANNLQFEIINPKTDPDPAQTNKNWSLTGAATVPSQDSFDDQGPPSSVFYLLWQTQNVTLNFDPAQFTVADGWKVQLFNQGTNSAYLGFGPAADLNVQPGDKFQFIMKGVTAQLPDGQTDASLTLKLESFFLVKNDAGSEGSAVLPTLIQPQGAKTLNLAVNLFSDTSVPAGTVLLTLDQNGLPDPDIKNRLQVTIQNNASEPLIPEGATSAGDPQIVITYAESDDPKEASALASAQDVARFADPSPDPSNLWDSERPAQDIFVVRPNRETNKQMLGANGSELKIVFDKVISHNQNPGATEMTVTVQGIPNYNVGRFKLELTKEFPPGIARFTVDKTKIGVGGAVNLSWIIFGINDENSLTLVQQSEGMLDQTLQSGAQVAQTEISGGWTGTLGVTLTESATFMLGTSEVVDSNRNNIQLPVVVIPPPRIKRFTGEAAVVDTGLELEFSWDVAEGNEPTVLTLNGQTVTGNGVTVTIGKGTPLQFTYKLEASNQFNAPVSSELTFGWQEVTRVTFDKAILPSSGFLIGPTKSWSGDPNPGQKLIIYGNDVNIGEVTAKSISGSTFLQNLFPALQVNAFTASANLQDLVALLPADGGNSAVGYLSASNQILLAGSIVDDSSWIAVAGSNPCWYLSGGNTNVRVYITVVDPQAGADFANPQLVMTLPAAQISFAVFSPNNTSGYLVAAKQIQTFQLKNGPPPAFEITQTLAFMVPDNITAAVVSPDGLRLFAGSDTGKIFVLELDPATNVPTLSTDFPIKLPAGALTAITVAPQGTILVAADAESLFFVPLDGQTPVRAFAKIAGLRGPLVFVPNSHSVVVNASTKDNLILALLAPGFTGGVAPPPLRE